MIPRPIVGYTYPARHPERHSEVTLTVETPTLNCHSAPRSWVGSVELVSQLCFLANNLSDLYVMDAATVFLVQRSMDWR